MVLPSPCLAHAGEVWWCNPVILQHTWGTVWSRRGDGMGEALFFISAEAVRGKTSLQHCLATQLL